MGHRCARDMAGAQGRGSSTKLLCGLLATASVIGESVRHIELLLGAQATVEFLMVETCAVFKLPVCCAACGSQQYETLLRISQATPLVCVECRQSIDLPRDNSAIFSRAVAFVEEERLKPILTSLSERGQADE